MKKSAGIWVIEIIAGQNRWQFCCKSAQRTVQIKTQNNSS